MKYIEKFSSLIPALQGNKVVKKVEFLKERGEIQTEAEYDNALQEILGGLSTTEFKPLFEYEPLTPEISSSEHFNETMDTIRDDLEVLFIELNNIFAAIKAHDLLFKDKLLDELHFILKELEDKETILSIIGDTQNSFDDVIFNSFNGDNFIIDRTSTFANEILFDTQKDEAIPETETVFIDAEEKVATLPLAQQEDILFTDAGIKTAETTVSEETIQLVDSDIKDILDPDTSSSWAYNILLKKQKKNGSKLSLELDLGDKREINFLRLHPVSHFPMLLERIQYININNEIVDLPDDSFFNRILNNPVRITFPDIIAKKIILKLSQSSSILFDLDKNKSKLTFDDLKRNANIKYNIPILSDNIKDSIQNPDILNVIPLAPGVSEKFDAYNQYIFAFKSITAGLSSYKDNGYFISKPHEKKMVGIIAVDSEEQIPEIYNEEIDQNVDASSMEYNIVKKDYNNAKEIIHSQEFPILPLNRSNVKDERLHFTGNYKLAKLRFLGHKSDTDGSGIKIYRNNVELIRGTDWRFFDRSNQLDDSDPDLQADLHATKIEILHNSDVIRTGIYTADYIPRYIQEPNAEVKVEDIIYLPDGTTEHPIKRGINDVEKSDLFLKIAIRNNSRSSNRTPKLKSYKLLVSSIDKDKYVRIK